MITKTPISEPTSMTAASEPPRPRSSETGWPKGLPPKPGSNQATNWWGRKSLVIAALAISVIVVHLVLRFGVKTNAVVSNLPLLAALVIITRRESERMHQPAHVGVSDRRRKLDSERLRTGRPKRAGDT